MNLGSSSGWVGAIGACGATCWLCLGGFLGDTVPHGRCTLPACTVIVIEYDNPPVVTVIVVIPALNAQSSPDVGSGVALPAASSSTLRGFADASSAFTKSAMSGLEELKAYAGATKRAQAVPWQVCGIAA